MHTILFSMIQLLFTVVLAEMVLILALAFRTPARKLLIIGLDRMKQGKAPVITKTLSVTISVVFISSIVSVTEIQRRTSEGGVLNPTDEVLVAHRLLEASFMGFILFLALVIDRLHYYIKELYLTRKNLAAAMKLKHEGEHQELQD